MDNPTRRPAGRQLRFATLAEIAADRPPSIPVRRLSPGAWETLQRRHRHLGLLAQEYDRTVDPDDVQAGDALLRALLIR